MKTNVMFRVLAIIMIISLIPILSCQKSEQELGFKDVEPQLKTTNTCVVDLIDKHDTIFGIVTADFTSPNDLVISYDITDPDYVMTETKLDIQLDPGDFPMTNNGNPKTGQFAYGAVLDNATSWSQYIELNNINGFDIGDMVYVAANAKVKKNKPEDAWGQGDPFPGPKFAMYFECQAPYPIPNCTTPVSPIDGSMDVPTNAILSWNPVDYADGYYIYFGTDNPPTNLQNGSDAGNALTFDPGTLDITTEYFWKITPYNSGGISSGCPVWSFTTDNWICGDPLVDERDGQSYNTVPIGDRCWMKENMNIGTMIHGSNSQTDNGVIEKYCYDNNIDNCDFYGGLYQWNEMMQYVTGEGAQGICPSGWHISTRKDWTALSNFIGGFDTPHGNELKSCRQVDSPLGGECATTDHPRWNAHSAHYGTDDYGLSFLPGGVRYNQTHFLYLGSRGLYWSSRQYFTSTGLSYASEMYVLLVGYGYLFWDDAAHKTFAYSVRCLRD